MFAAVVTALLVVQTAQAHPAPNAFPFPDWTTRPRDASILLTAPRTTYVAGEDVRIHVRVINTSNHVLGLTRRVPDWFMFGITIKNDYIGEIPPNVPKEMTPEGPDHEEFPPHGSYDYSAATGTTLRHWGYALATPGTYTIRVFSESPNKTRIYSNAIAIRIVLGPY
jgi:hypothetical protein